MRNIKDKICIYRRKNKIKWEQRNLAKAIEKTAKIILAVFLPLKPGLAASSCKKLLKLKNIDVKIKEIFYKFL